MTAPRAPVPLPAWQLFGIRHHGPGCARSLLHALDAMQPDAVLIEGPPDADALLRLVDGPEGAPLLLSPQMRPPVALLSHAADEPNRARWHPFAEFSPEWQALRWATERGVPVRFIDLPMTHVLALEQAQDQAREQALQATAAEAAAAEAEATAPAAAPAAAPNDDTAAAPPPAQPGDVADALCAEAPTPTTPPAWRDPLDWLARAAGHADGEAWWNHMVEERGDGRELFAAIDEALCTLRAELPPPPLPPHEVEHEALREAHMRQCVRAAVKEGFERIAVVVGAWHLGGLKAGLSAKPGAPLGSKADAAALKGLPKLKVACTWVPWTHRHLTRASGYGAGIEAPGWYEHLWHCSAQPQADAAHHRSVGWMARVARLMRERGLDCSSAHLIEAARLADTLAALRQRPAAGLPELDEACRSVLTLGDDSVLAFLHDALRVGDRLGQVPPEVPAVPLQRDLERQQKLLRLPPEATRRTLELDLRQPTHLARSHLLHRLHLLELPWGEPVRGGNSQGTFRELWQLQWEPTLAVKLIEASVWGVNVQAAASARAQHLASQATALPVLSGLINRALLAELPEAVGTLAHALAQRAAVSSDTVQLLEALPALARTFRYGNVRQTDASMVAHVLDELAQRAALALPLAATQLDDTSAAQLRQAVLGAHSAIGLREQPELSAAWHQALARLADRIDTHPLLQGLSTRLLLDAQQRERSAVAQALGLHLSAGSAPAHAAAWLEGFLNGNATVLLHDTTVWALVDGWLCSLSEGHFLRVLPMVRRSFSSFAAADLRDLGERAAQGRSPSGPGSASDAHTLDWDLDRAALPLPFLATVLGLTWPTPSP